MRKAIIISTVIAAVFIFAAITQASDNIRIFVNGKEIYSDVPPQVIGGRTMVPVRFVAEALNADVKWDQSTGAVNVNTENRPFANIFLAENITLDENERVSLSNVYSVIFNKGNYYEFMIYSTIDNLTTGSHSVKVIIKNPKGKAVYEKLQRIKVEKQYEIEGGYYSHGVSFDVDIEFEDTGKHTIEIFVNDNIAGKGFCYSVS